MGRRILTMADRAQIAAGIKANLDDRAIGELIDRCRTVVRRERRRNSTKARATSLFTRTARHRIGDGGPDPQDR